MNTALKIFLSPASAQGINCRFKGLLTVLLIVVAHIQFDPIALADSEAEGQYPWSGEAAQLVGRYIAIEHILGQGGAETGPNDERPVPRGEATATSGANSLSAGLLALGLVDRDTRKVLMLTRTQQQLQDQQWRRTLWFNQIQNQRWMQQVRPQSQIETQLRQLQRNEQRQAMWLQDQRLRQMQSQAWLEQQTWKQSQMMARLQDQSRDVLERARRNQSDVLSRIRDQGRAISDMQSRLRDQTSRQNDVMARIRDQSRSIADMQSRLRDQVSRQHDMMARIREQTSRQSDMLRRMQNTNSLGSSSKMREMQAQTALAMQHARQTAESMRNIARVVSSTQLRAAYDAHSFSSLFIGPGFHAGNTERVLANARQYTKIGTVQWGEAASAHSLLFGIRERDLANRALMQEARNGQGRYIAGAGGGRSIDDIKRLVSTYGGETADWAKKSSAAWRGHEGPSVRKIEIHWYENIKTGERVEFKTKFKFPGQRP